MKLFSLFCLVATAPLTVGGVPQYDEAGNTMDGGMKQEKDDRHLQQVHGPVINKDEKRKLGLRGVAAAPQEAHGAMVFKNEKNKLGLHFLAMAPQGAHGPVVNKDEKRKLGSRVLAAAPQEDATVIKDETQARVASSQEG
jgi:hypothetical protein